MNIKQQPFLKFPFIKNCFTVKTNNGYHIYFKYNELVNTTTNALINFKSVDIRNDNSIVIAPPTTYKLLNGNIAKYEFIGGQLFDIQTEIILELKQFEIKLLPKEIIPKKN